MAAVEVGVEEVRRDPSNDVAFALVWADGTSVTNANEAYAFASRTRCTTVSVAFQVVLISGSADIAIPQKRRRRRERQLTHRVGHRDGHRVTH